MIRITRVSCAFSTWFCLLAFCSLQAEEITRQYTSVSLAKDGQQTMNGLVMPLDQDGRNFYLRNEDGLIEVKLAEGASIGLIFRENGIKEMLEARLVQIEGKEYPLPKELSIRVQFSNWKSAQGSLKSGKIQGGRIHAGKLPEHLPTEKELWLSGPLVRFEDGHITPKKILRAGGKEFEVSTSGHNYSEQVLGLFESKDITPFNHQASVYGTMEKDVFVAKEVLLRPVIDPVALDDPKLPRYLFIGDSISGNYGNALREALKGKVNAHHPPTNCGPSGKCAERAQIWMGEYEKKGRHWDVISFNCGHWDAGTTKEVYQGNLERLISQVKQTGAKLIWVSTAPVPEGFDEAGEVKPDGKAPGRTAGVMKKYLNPWALEIVKKHPEITICDQWQLVEDGRDGLYKEWWGGKDVHFKGEPADALGRLLADHVLKRLAE